MSDDLNEVSPIQGSCLCGSVTYEVRPPFKLFQYCHCSRCRKITGSAFGSNIYATSAQLTWLSGEDNIQRYELEDTKYFASSFCRTCGSNLPWQVKSADTLIIPAGTIDNHPEISPKQNIHCASKAPWFLSSSDLPSFDTLPPRKR